MAHRGSHPPQGDRALVLAFQRGERSAYDEIYRRYAPRVKRTCGRILINPQDVDEAVQETFLKAYTALGRFNGRYRVGAWLNRIAANVCIDQLRSSQKGINLVGFPVEPVATGQSRGPEDVVVGDHPRVEIALHDMQPLHARALHLRVVEGLSHDEMAGRLDMTPAQVKALLHRARRSFRRAWDKAEALALAPILALRSWYEERAGGIVQAGPSASNLAAVGASNASMFAERVAASAVLVAVALAGMPTEPSAATGEFGGDAPVTIVASEDGFQAAEATVRVTSDSVVVALAPAAQDVDAGLVPEVGKLVPPPPEKPKDPGDGGGGGGGDDPPLIGPGAADTKRVERRVKRVIEELGKDFASHD